MNKDNGYDEILNFISEHGIHDKDANNGKIKKTSKKYPKRNRNTFQREIDLHGKKEEEAEKILRSAINNAKNSSIKKLLIIHGKGIHSDPFDGPILKKVADSMLNFEFKDIVREYYPAPYNKGGSGATIVILK